MDKYKNAFIQAIKSSDPVTVFAKEVGLSQEEVNKMLKEIEREKEWEQKIYQIC